MAIGSGTYANPAAETSLSLKDFASAWFVVFSSFPNRSPSDEYALFRQDSSPQNLVMRLDCITSIWVGSRRRTFLFISMIGKLRKISIDFMLPAVWTTDQSK